MYLQKNLRNRIAQTELQVSIIELENWLSISLHSILALNTPPVQQMEVFNDLDCGGHFYIVNRSREVTQHVDYFFTS